MEDEIDVSRGDVIVHANAQLGTTNHMQAHIVWMSESPLKTGGQYLFKFASKLTAGIVSVINHQIDVNNQQHLSKDHLDLNDIALVEVELSQSVVIDPYEENRATGAFIIIDRLTNITVAAGMVTEVLKVAKESLVDTSNAAEFEKELEVLVNKYFPNKNSGDLSILLKKIKPFYL